MARNSGWHRLKTLLGRLSSDNRIYRTGQSKNSGSGLLANLYRILAGILTQVLAVAGAVGESFRQRGEIPTTIKEFSPRWVAWQGAVGVCWRLLSCIEHILVRRCDYPNAVSMKLRLAPGLFFCPDSISPPTQLCFSPLLESVSLHLTRAMPLAASSSSGST